MKAPVIEKYWQLESKVNTSVSQEEAIENFQLQFSQSVKRRMRSDVPIGTSLSGGLDSSAVVAYCHKEASAQYSHKCFTASFTGFEKDELKYAEKVARQYKLAHHIVNNEEKEIPVLMQ